MMRKATLYTVILTLIFLAGCGTSNDETVATIGSHKVTLGEVRDFDIVFPQRFASAEKEFEAKKRHVDSLVNLRLLVIGAYQNDLDIDREVLDIIESQKPKFLLDELYKKEILPNTKVTDAEIESFYEKLKEEIHISHIIVDRQELADSLYEAITNGADFDQLARDFSLDQSTARLGGDLGWIRWGRLLDSFQDVVFKMSREQISKPFETESGWHIVRLNEKRESNPGPYEDLKPMLRSQIQSRKQQNTMDSYLDGLEEKYDVELNDEVYETMLGLINKFYPDTLGGKYFRKTSIDGDILEEYQKSQILAHYKGGEVTVGDYFDAINAMPATQRPEFKNKSAVKLTIFSMNMNDFLTVEAQSQGLDKVESYERVMKVFRESVMADKMRTLVTDGIPELTDEEYYQYYDSHIDDFRSPARVKVSEIRVDDLAFAESLRTLLDNGADFETLAEEHTTRPGMKPRKGDLGYFEIGKRPEIYKLAEKLRINEIKGPAKTDDGKWSIIKKTGFEAPRTKGIEEVAANIQKLLNFEKRKIALDNWIEAKSAETTIEVNYDLIWETIDKSKYEDD